MQLFSGAGGSQVTRSSNVIGKAFDVVGVVLFVYLALFILVIGGLALGAWIIG